MKTYFRLLSFAKPIGKFAVPYIFTTIFTVIFSTLNLVLLVPLLNTIFFSKQGSAAIAPAAIRPSIFHALDFFKYYMNFYIYNYGPWGALKFVCATIVVSVLLGNFFRYLSQRIMENLRVHTLLNFRRAVFNNVMNLHLSYFSNERKGDIISKIASDVQVVQYSVTGTLQVVFKEPLQLIAYMVALFIISKTYFLFVSNYTNFSIYYIPHC